MGFFAWLHFCWVLVGFFEGCFSDCLGFIFWGRIFCLLLQSLGKSQKRDLVCGFFLRTPQKQSGRKFLTKKMSRKPTLTKE